MPFKRFVNDLLGLTGYQISRRASLQKEIARGAYRWLQSRDIATVLDIGANTGQFARMARAILPDATIYSFEPLTECFDELQAASRSLQPMQCFRVALGCDNTERTIWRSSFAPGSSFLPVHESTTKIYPHVDRGTAELVTLRSLDAMASELALRPGILLKADVQGYELEVLKGAEQTLPAIDVLILETSFVELYEGQPLFDEVHGHLTRRDFMFAGMLDQTPHPETGAILQGDAVYVNLRPRPLATPHRHRP